MSDMRLLTSYEVFNYTPEMIKESRDTHSGKIIMKGILQKADTLNQNGRIYPKHILEREIRNYQKFIIENRALGECVPPGTEIMTRDGWKNIEDVVEGETIATLNIDTDELEYQRIKVKIDKEYSGMMLHIKNQSTIDMKVTPDHRILVWDCSQKPTFIRGYEFLKMSKEGSSWLDRSSLRRNAKLTGDDIDVINIPGLGSTCAPLDQRFVSVEEVPYEGRVYCVTVDNGTWLMRSNGKAFWTGNCDHPDESVVSLKNVSHIIREAFLDKDVVYGTVELLDTPSGKILQSLVESGVKLGISSRGVGSTKKQGDYVVVQDDFQLICWDFVSEPSTPGAFMLPEGKRITEGDLRKVFNRSDRINRIVNDILLTKKNEV